jgi:hypothetical protein
LASPLRAHFPSAPTGHPAASSSSALGFASACTKSANKCAYVWDFDRLPTLQVEFFQPVQPAKKDVEEVLAVGAGSGSKLRDIPNVAFKLSKVGLTRS